MSTNHHDPMGRAKAVADLAGGLILATAGVGAPGAPTAATYRVDPIDGGSQITLHHRNFVSAAGQ
jgi:hypothetical protein